MTRLGTCHIVAAGRCDRLQLERKPGDMVIAADAGYRLCKAAGQDIVRV